ncbi:MAG: hypothetical protein NXI15_11730 [Gammaproteobacteria bacterium]|nr:hypothetical protein [Gammaproteobacteria bacterium]
MWQAVMRLVAVLIVGVSAASCDNSTTRDEATGQEAEVSGQQFNLPQPAVGDQGGHGAADDTAVGAATAQEHHETQELAPTPAAAPAGADAGAALSPSAGNAVFDRQEPLELDLSLPRELTEVEAFERPRQDGLLLPDLFNDSNNNNNSDAKTRVSGGLILNDVEPEQPLMDRLGGAKLDVKVPIK